MALKKMKGPATKFHHEKNVELFGEKGAAMYEALRRQRYDRESAAKIVNAARKKGEV